jgi:cell division septation protein DedD
MTQYVSPYDDPAEVATTWEGEVKTSHPISDGNYIALTTSGATVLCQREAQKGETIKYCQRGEGDATYLALVDNKDSNPIVVSPVAQTKTDEEIWAVQQPLSAQNTDTEPVTTLREAPASSDSEPKKEPKTRKKREPKQKASLSPLQPLEEKGTVVTEELPMVMSGTTEEENISFSIFMPVKLAGPGRSITITFN